MIAPAAVKFNTDHYILGGAYHCAMAVRGYPTVTEALALLSSLGESSGVALSIYVRRVTPSEEQKIIQNASNRNRFQRGNSNDMKQSVTAEANIQDVATLVTTMHRNREPLDHCAVYIDLAAKDLESLRTLRDSVSSELVRSKLAYDRLLLKQREGFLTANPAGRNALGTQFERVLPASSVANLYPNNYSGKTDPQGFYIGKDSSSYGYYVMIDHGGGLATLYAHNSKLLVKAGDTVQAGDAVSLSGSTGRSTGPHLHFEVRVNGERTDPRSYLP